jgi:hypothetical protein
MVNTPIDATEIFDALETFIKQRPGLDARDYGFDTNGRAAYRAEIRDIGKDKVRAMKALDEARALSPVRADVLLDSFRAFSGRLSWTPPPSNSLGVTTGLVKGRLSYCNGQYAPTEYRKAAASVLETYIAAWRRAENEAAPQTFVYQTIEDVKAANRAIGNHWFDRSTMSFFNCKIESGLIAGRYFITSEKNEDRPRLFSVRAAMPDGSIDTIGEFQAYISRDDARAAIKSLVSQKGQA